MKKKQKEYSLLPYIEEKIYGLSPEYAQIVGWEINKFNIPDLWKTSTGEGVKIAVIDTGCDYNHPDIKNNILEGKNFIYNNNDPMDDNGHGSHCAGSIAAENNRLGMVGVAPKAKIIPVKVLDNKGNGNLKSIVNGIVWSVDNGADILSMSLGSPAPSIQLENAIKYAASKGCIVFCAAGNDGPSKDIMYPAKYDHTIAIGAIDRNLERTPFTCSGDALDFLAPGHDILSCVPGGGYALMSGTSMSTPFVVGCAALLLSYSRNNNIKLNNTNDYISIFKKHSRSLNNPQFRGQKRYEGYGILYPTLQ